MALMMGLIMANKIRVLHSEPAKMLKGDLARILCDMLHNGYCTSSHYMRNYTKTELVEIYKKKVKGIK